MSLADDYRDIAAVIEVLETEGIDVADARPLGHQSDGVRAQVVIDVDAATVQELRSGDAPESYLPAEAAPVDEDQDDGDGDEPDNPYAPDDYGTLSVGESSTGPYVNVPKRVAHDIDADRMHIREHDGRVELVSGGSDEWPDYVADRGASIERSAVVEDMLDVVPGDEVRAVPDGDVIVLEPNRIADRPEPDDQSAIDELCEGLTDGEATVLRALDEEGEIGSSDLEETTGLSYQGVHNALSTLRDDDIVTTRKDPDDGRRTLYSLADGIGDDQADDLDAWDSTCDECGESFESPTDLQKHQRNTVCGGLPDHVDEDDYAEIVAEADTIFDVQEALRVSRERTRVPLADRGDLADLQAKSPQERVAQADVVQDGGAVASSDTAASATCQNCGSQVTAQYARVFTPEDEENPRMCPECPDKVRDGNDVRDRRDKGGSD